MFCAHLLRQKIRAPWQSSYGPLNNLTTFFSLLVKTFRPQIIPVVFTYTSLQIKSKEKVHNAVLSHPGRSQLTSLRHWTYLVARPFSHKYCIVGLSLTPYKLPGPWAFALNPSWQACICLNLLVWILPPHYHINKNLLRKITENHA